MDWGFTIAVVITGIVVVFVVLTILVMLCTGMGAFFGTENQAPKVEAKPTPKVEPKAVVETSPTPQPAIEEGISNEVVAAISASLAVILGEESANYQISSVKLATGQEQPNKRASKTAWSTAGFVENTRPF